MNINPSYDEAVTRARIAESKRTASDGLHAVVGRLVGPTGSFQWVHTFQDEPHEERYADGVRFEPATKAEETPR